MADSTFQLFFSEMLDDLVTVVSLGDVQDEFGTADEKGVTQVTF
jgi:hypothetical protein